MSKLANYLEQAQVSQADFAARLGVKQSTVSRLKNGRFVPSLALAARIEALTQGAVPATALLPAFQNFDDTAPASHLPVTESALMAATPPGDPGTSTNHESFHETSPDDAA